MQSIFGWDEFHPTYVDGIFLPLPIVHLSEEEETQKSVYVRAFY